MSDIRGAYLVAAESAVTLLRDAALAAAWEKESALPKFSVRGLAGHLAGQLFNVEKSLAEPVREAAPIPLLDHYGRAAWIGTDLDDEANARVRTGGEGLAEGGPAVLAERAAESLARLRAVLPAEPAGRTVFLPWTGWSLTLDDLLVTRMMEIAVHSDDLAVSIGVPAPELPEEALEPVLSLLARLAVRRHGQAAVLRAFSRAERAPERINAI